MPDSPAPRPGATADALGRLSPRTRRLLLGDWNPVVRDPLDVLRLTFFAAAVVLVFTGGLGQAVRMALTGVAVLLPRLLDVPRLFDLGFLLGMSLQAWGNVFDLFSTTSWYDLLVHFVLTGAVALLAYLALARYTDSLRRPEEEIAAHDRPVLVAVVTGLGAVIDALYELYEWGADQLLGTNLNRGWGDTLTDFGVAVAGSFLAGLFLVVWARYGWGSMRRPSGDRLRDGVAADAPDASAG